MSEHFSRIYTLKPTLRQAWSRKWSETAMCVQDIDDQCVLQITLIHAVCCALHRLASQVIHRIGLYFVKCLWIIKMINKDDLFTKVKSSDLKSKLFCLASGRYSNGWIIFTPHDQSKDRLSWVILNHHERYPTMLKQAWIFKWLRCIATMCLYAEHVNACACSEWKQALRKRIMILPQVHLRKPCYDFYFL